MKVFLIPVLLALFFAFSCSRPVANVATNPATNANQIDQPANGAHENSAAQKVTVTSIDGTRIVGSYFETEPNSPAILFLHQWQSDRHSFDDFARRMQARGANVLSIDGRGFGESTNKANGNSVAAGRTASDVKAMLDDVDAAVEFLKAEKNVDPKRIGIVGASYGSSLAIIYAADHPDIKAVALLSPGLDYFGNMPTKPAVGKYGDRALLMVASDDDKESADAVRELKTAGTSDKYQTQIYPKGGHGTNIFQAKVGLEDLLEKFLTASLKQ